MIANTIETGFQELVAAAGADLPEAIIAFRHVFFAGAGAAFLAVNNINASTETTIAEKEAALAALHDEIDSFIRGRSPPTATRQ
jgi:hypothetical protein